MSADLDVEWVLPAGAAAGVWPAGLRAMGEVRRLSEQTVCWRLLDTFDRRLLAAGWMLGVDAAANRCLIARDRGRFWYEGPCMATEPRWAANLEGLPAQAKLAGLIDVRALLPQFTLKVQRQTWVSAALARETSAECQWLLEHWTVVNDLGSATVEIPLPARVRLLAPQGSRKRMRELGEALREADWKPADLTPYAEAVAVSGTGLAGSPTTLVVIEDSGLRTDAAVKRILRGLHDTLRRNEPGTLAETDTEFLHDYRVAVRRTRALLGQLGAAFPARVTDRFRRHFADLAEVTGPARDWDVFLLALPILDARLPRAMQGQLDPLRRLVDERGRAAHVRLNVRLRSAGYRRFIKAWAAFLEKPVPRRPSTELAVMPIGEQAGRRIWKLYRRLLREGRAITDQSPDDALHALRKTAKKLRYQMELFQGLYDPEPLAVLLRHLKKLQNLLGEFQDASVQIGHLRDLADELGGRDAPLDGLLAVGALLALLHDDQARQRRHFGEVFAKFASHGHRRQFRRLFRPAPATGQADGGDGAG